jgi:cytochrome c-type biogenesis protein CcmH/NrfG
MSDALVPALSAGAIEGLPQLSLGALPALPWRDPHNVPKEELGALIARLEQACLDQPRSADLRTCLGMARAMNFDVYKSMDALDEARTLDPTSFWAQMKYAELHYRLRALMRAERETQKALELAQNVWQLGIARRQLQEIRRLMHEGARLVDWTKSLTVPAVFLSVMLVVVFVVMWR